MSDLGDLLGLPLAVERARRRRLPCRNPDCDRLVYADRAVYGYGRCCAETLGLVVHRVRVGSAPQTGPDLLAELDALAGDHPDDDGPPT
ncbi:hypothetical protein [Micromonospora sp. RP3T]|uniref:hypothetical protein n=1 Tax=Micromonospora sp. RP3T TaxID=2135446 RepID=UPI003D737C4C